MRGINVLVLAVCAMAWVSPQEIPRFKGGVDVVQFTVTVLDKDRHPITGLSAEDFDVLVDGKSTPLAAFAAVTLPAESSTPAASALLIASDVQTNQLPAEGRLVVIVIDRSTPSGEPVRTAREVANAAIDHLGPSDLGAIVFTAKGMQKYSQGLTTDRARLHAAVAAALIGPGEEPGEKIPIAAGMDKGTVVNSPDAPAGSAAPARGAPAARAETRASRVQLASEEQSGECYCGLCVPDDLTALAKTLSRAPVRYKSVLFVGSDIALAAQDPTSKCAALIYPARDRLSRALDVANVRFDAIDPRGLEPLGESAELAAPVGATEQRLNQFRQSSLGVLPDYTGGITVLNTNAPERRVGSIFDESRSYYVIALARERGVGKDGRHQVKVSVKRRDATVRTRNLYFAANTSADIPHASDPANAMLTELLPGGDFRLQMNLLPQFATDGSARIHVLLGADSSIAGKLDVLVRAYDRVFTPVGGPIRQRLNVPASAVAGSATFQWTSVLTPPPGDYEVRVAVATTDGKHTANVIGYIDVPDVQKQGLALSGISVKSGSDSTVQREFHAGSSIGLSFQIARAKNTTGTVSVRYALRDEIGQEVANIEVPHERATPVAPGVDGYEIGIRLPPGPGRYVATIEASDGRRPVRREVPLTVR